MRSICVFTGTRAEYGLLKPLLRLLQAEARCEMKILVSGAHLGRSTGYTVQEIELDGLPTDFRAGILMDSADENAVTTAMGLGLMRYGEMLSSLKPDLAVVLGDRYEAFAYGAAVTVHKIPLAHIHGGEATRDLIDEAFRHALTKMSHLHFVSCEDHRRRVIQLGEAPERVWNVGALGVENALSLQVASPVAIRERLQLEPGRPYILCTMHPVTLDDDSLRPVEALLAALEVFSDYAVVFTGANADPGGAQINRLLQSRAYSAPDRFRFFMSLGLENYLAAARAAACVAGNSSSGLVEVPSFGTPVLDIGGRQAGRVRSEAVLQCEAEAEAIVAGLNRALEPGYRQICTACPNPYERPGTAATICEILVSASLENLLKKPFYDI